MVQYGIVPNSQNITMDGQQVLLRELADLLGFEDGAEDVLEHLLTINTQEVCHLG